jgi:glycosyltransferase involved in cell wall biosynthesis
MKITFVMTYAGTSGGTRVIATHARQLMNRGHQVQVFSTAARPANLRRKVSTLVRTGKLPPVFKPGKSFFDGTGIPHTPIDQFRPLTDADLPDADVVVATWWETAPWVLALSASKGAKAFFIQHYETWGGQTEEVDAAWRLPLHKIVISRWLADLAAQKFADRDISHVPNSVDMQLFHAPPRGKQPRPTVGLLYNPHWIKGCSVSLRAIAQARKVLPDLDLVAFGEKPEVESLPLGPQSRLTLNPPQENIRDLYAQCDVWLCGSRSEGFHLPPLEAMACRCPVVSTEVGGPLDTIEEGRNGFLVKVEDHAALADRLVKVLQLSDQKWQEMSDAAYATACRYTWQDAAVLMERALEAAIAKNVPRAGRLGAVR